MTTADLDNAPAAPLAEADGAADAALAVVLAAAVAAGSGTVVETDEDLMVRLLPAVEGLVFAADHPVALKDLAACLQGEGELRATLTVVQGIVERLKARHDGVNSGMLLQEIAGGVAMRTAPAVARFLRRANTDKPFRLGRAALETLAIVAYRQPITKAQVDELRGVDSSGALKSVLDRQLIRVLGKAEEVGRPLLYGTTRTFLEAFNLRMLSDLPTLREYQELNAESQAKVDAQAPAALGRIRELAQPGARLVSAEAETEGSQAMDELERALGAASASARSAEVLLKAGGRLPPGLNLDAVVQQLAPQRVAQDVDDADAAPADEPSGDASDAVQDSDDDGEA